MKTVKRSAFTTGMGERRDEKVEHRGYLKQWNYSVQSKMVHKCHYTFLQIPRMYTTKREPLI